MKITKANTVKFIAYCVVLPSILLGSSFYFNKHYSLDRDFQDEKSLNYTWYLVKKEKPLKSEMKVGNLYAFYLDKEHKDKDHRFVKELVAKSGDTIEINRQNEIKVNGKVVRNDGLYHARNLKMTEEQMYGTMTLKDNEFYFLGTTIKSFDSRYFGAIDYSAVTGSAYAIY